MRGSKNLIVLAVLGTLSCAVAGCSTANFDPTDMLDFLDTKKKLPGERKPVFPEGVPGLEQGVPKDLYRGSRQQVDQPNPATAAAPPPEEPQAKGAKSKGRSKQAAAPSAAAADPDAQPEEEGSTAAAPPPPKPAKIVRRRTTAPPPDPPAQQQQQAQPAQGQQQSAFPAPLPSGGFSR
jgi:hypothetical protein